MKILKKDQNCQFFISFHSVPISIDIFWKQKAEKHRSHLEINVHKYQKSTHPDLSKMVSYSIGLISKGMIYLLLCVM